MRKIKTKTKKTALSKISWYTTLVLYMIVAVVIVVAAEVVIVVVVISNIYRMLTTYWQFPTRFKYLNILTTKFSQQIL